MAKWVCQVCGYVYEGDAAQLVYLLRAGKDATNMEKCLSSYLFDK